ncbi:hypothetical protein [Salegentibacter chungangensis]|uniref:DUF1573 domain-containing protein n=1 Tax=Salegentibacter chungangensis TaxID=1335724 RepID=A0ABW3NVC8_9FLAO
MKFKNNLLVLFSLFLLLSGTQPMSAQETTKVMVRAKAKDAKFIGSSIGGARILIRDAQSGEILAEGTTAGSTGDTKRIMKEPQKRGQDLSDENTAGFEAELELEEPVFVSVEAYAPNNKRQARVLSSTQLWLLPGKDISGDGIVLEVPGFVVDLLSPQTHERITSDKPIEIRANVVMMCGCPVTPGGIWDADQYEVNAMISSEGKQVREVPLKFADKTSTFSVETKLEPGLYEIAVYAYDPETGNTGLDRTNIIIK